jgi:hypothetical protein
MPEGYPWGMPLHYNIGYKSNVFEIPILVVPNTTAIPQLGKTIPQVTVTIPQPTVTISTPYVERGPVYRKYLNFQWLGDAFIRQYKYNVDMAPNRD